MSEQHRTSYDEVPYDSIAFSSTHPETLATMARLFGLTSPDIDNCRVLELGCASGGNLIPMAETLPGSRFHGVDLAAGQVAEGLGVIRRLALKNISLQHADIMSFDAALGQFDYIICHGVYSWVSDAVRKKIMAICHDHLSAKGVAYISYNTYPGWHMRASVREMMKFHSARFDNTTERIEQARALLDFLVQAVPANTDSAYGRLLRDELDILHNRADTYLFHEHLEEHNDALYFHQFIEHASEAGLMYLAEAHLSDMLPAGRFEPDVEQTLRDIAPDIIEMEQYLDFLRNRVFRRTLLCHKHIELTREIESATLHDFYVSSPLAPESVQADDAVGDGLSFEHPNGSRVTVQQPIEQEALNRLYSMWPASVTVRELTRQIVTDGKQSDQHEQCLAIISQLVLTCLSADLVEISLAPARFSTTPGATPTATGLARYQAQQETWVTNLKHTLVFPDEFAREVLSLLEGQLDAGALKDALVDKALTGELVVKRDGQRLTDPAVLYDVMDARVEEKLRELAGLALLV